MSQLCTKIEKHICRFSSGELTSFHVMFMRSTTLQYCSKLHYAMNRVKYYRLHYDAIYFTIVKYEVWSMFAKCSWHIIFILNKEWLLIFAWFRLLALVKFHGPTMSMSCGSTLKWPWTALAIIQLIRFDTCCTFAGQLRWLHK